MEHVTENWVEQVVKDSRDEILNILLKAFTAQDKSIEERFTRLEERLDQLDQIQAILSSAYAEVAAMIESILSVLLNKDEEQRKEFFTALGESRKTMLETLTHATQYAESTADKFVAHSTNPDEGSTGNSGSTD